MTDRESLYQDQLKRVLRNIDSHPYLLLQRGPALKPCPMHGRFEGLVLRADHPYWRASPMGRHPDCLCHVRSVSQRELVRLKKDGVPDSDSPMQLDPKTGLSTGHRLDRRVPIKLSLTD